MKATITKFSEHIRLNFSAINTAVSDYFSQLKPISIFDFAPQHSGKKIAISAFLNASFKKHDQFNLMFLLNLY